MPADRVLHPETIFDRIARLERRLGELERVARLANISTDDRGMQTDSVILAQSTTSANFTDLATVGPTVTVTVGKSGRLLILWSAALFALGGTKEAVASFEVTDAAGTVLLAADDSRALLADGINVPARAKPFRLTGLPTGRLRIRAKYRSPDGTTVSFDERDLIAIPL